MSERPTIVWFRRDLRLADHPALRAACQAGGPVIPVFVWAPDEEKPWAPGAASRWWLHHALQSLDRSLQSRGARLRLAAGRSGASLLKLARETGATRVFWNRLYEPTLVARDEDVRKALREAGVEAQSFPVHLLHEPGAVLSQKGTPYQVFTAFFHACLDLGDPSVPEKAPARIPSPARAAAGADLDALKLLPSVDWAAGLRATWRPGADGARARLAAFADGPVTRYGEDRDRPDREGTSRLSPHLHFGEISAREVWHAIRRRQARNGPAGEPVGPYLRQLVWREFAHHLLAHFPHTDREPLRPEFARFPWRKDPAGLRAWQRGRTGFPIVDAAMRELWHTGWMHNRARMLVASFLTKNLLLPWPEGARWFWDTLVDADLANNTMGWQWTAGSGADAAPYFRIFNPVLQGAKFDPEGQYIRRWVPERARLTPILSLAETRDRALSAYSSIRSPRGERAGTGQLAREGEPPGEPDGIADTARREPRPPTRGHGPTHGGGRTSR